MQVGCGTGDLVTTLHRQQVPATGVESSIGAAQLPINSLPAEAMVIPDVRSTTHTTTTGAPNSHTGSTRPPFVIQSLFASRWHSDVPEDAAIVVSLDVAQHVASTSDADRHVRLLCSSPGTAVVVFSSATPGEGEAFLGQPASFEAQLGHWVQSYVGACCRVACAMFEHFVFDTALTWNARIARFADHGFRLSPAFTVAIRNYLFQHLRDVALHPELPKNVLVFANPQHAAFASCILPQDAEQSLHDAQWFRMEVCCHNVTPPACTSQRTHLHTVTVRSASHTPPRSHALSLSLAGRGFTSACSPCLVRARRVCVPLDAVGGRVTSADSPCCTASTTSATTPSVAPTRARCGGGRP